MSGLIEIVKFERQERAGNLRALASVRIGKVVIHDFRVVQEKHKRAFIQAPIRTWVRDGKQQFGGPLVELPDDIMCEIRNQLTLRWAEVSGEYVLHG